VPFQQGRVDAIGRGGTRAPPLRHFMLKYAREKRSWRCFSNWPGRRVRREPRTCPCGWWCRRTSSPSCVPDFRLGGVVSAFLVIDLVVAAVTTSIGMMQLPPVIISTPLKILLFVMVDGWNLLVGVADEELCLSGRAGT